MQSKQKNYIVGIYARLSKEDAKDEENDSLSIENQKLMLTAYAEKQGWEIYDTYADDGMTGTTFEPPRMDKTYQRRGKQAYQPCSRKRYVEVREKLHTNRTVYRLYFSLV